MKSTNKPFIIFILLLTVLFQANAYGEERALFHQITAADGLSDNSAQVIKCTFSGRMTILVQGDINFYDGGNFVQINNDEDVRYRLDDYQGRYRLYYDNSHHLWLKGNDGLLCVNLVTEKSFVNIDSVLATYGAKKRVDNLFVDVNGDVWLSVDHHLFCQKYGHKIPLLKGHKLQDIEVYDKEHLMMFYSGGLLVCYDLKTGRRLYQNKEFSADLAEIYNLNSVYLRYENSFYAIHNSENGSILLQYNVDTRKWKEIMRTERILNNLVAHDGKLYIPSDLGYFTYEFTSGEIQYYKALRLRNGRRLETDMNVIEFDLQGGMWIGTSTRGLLYSSPLNVSVHLISSSDPEAAEYLEKLKPLKPTTYYFRGKKVNGLYVDSRGWTWIATPNGLQLYMSPKEEPMFFSRKNGLLNNIIHAIIEDDYHNIWVSTSFGIVCLHIVDKEVKQVFYFGPEDNVPNETFIDAKAIKLPDGRIVMQSIDHVVIIDPSDYRSFFNQKAYVLYPKMNKLLVNGIDVEAGDKVAGEMVLERAITRTKIIDLTYEQNSISMTFSAQNYARPLKTFYRVRVRELNDEWVDYSYFNSHGLVDRKGQLHLPLSNLQPGTYHVQLLSSVVEGQFVGEVYEWIVNVHQPWWRTTGLILLFGLIVLILVALNMLVYNRNTRLKIKRNSAESDVLSRIKSFVSRCDAYENEKLAPTQEEIYGTNLESRVTLNNDFVDAMLKIIPYVHERNGRPFTMHMLANAVDMDVIELYEMISENIHKSPRALIRSMRIDKAAELLRTTDKTVEEIAVKCDFISPNYMIAKFYHRFKMTPREYREELGQ